MEILIPDKITFSTGAAIYDTLEVKTFLIEKTKEAIIITHPRTGYGKFCTSLEEYQTWYMNEKLRYGRRISRQGLSYVKVNDQGHFEYTKYPRK